MKKYLLVSSSLIVLGTFSLTFTTSVIAAENDPITEFQVEEQVSEVNSLEDIILNEDVVIDPVNIENTIIPPEDFVPVLQASNDNGIQLFGAGNVQTYGPFYHNVTGKVLNSFIAKNTPASLNLEAASRKAVLAKYGNINTTKTYRIKWYNRLQTSQYGGSTNGKIVNYSCVN